jgi:hypothetical protein
LQIFDTALVSSQGVNFRDHAQPIQVPIAIFMKAVALEHGRVPMLVHFLTHFYLLSSYKASTNSKTEVLWLAGE